jgi:hypothetical protein
MDFRITGRPAHWYVERRLSPASPWKRVSGPHGCVKVARRYLFAARHKAQGDANSLDL